MTLLSRLEGAAEGSARVRLRGWREGSTMGLSVKLGTDPLDLIDECERADLAIEWGRSRRIVSVDGSGAPMAIALSYVRSWASQVVRATVYLPRTLRNIAKIKRHWNEYRAAIIKAKGDSHAD